MQPRARPRLRRSLAALVVAAAWAATAAAADGCIIAEPTEDLPSLPPMRPNIVRGSVVPSPSKVLGTFPDKFIVPVELADPTVTFEWSAFIDYDPVTGNGLVDVRQSVFEPSSLQGRVRVLEIPIPAPPDLDRCHTIEVVVALKLLTRTDPKSAHTPADPGGDSVTWLYSPGGDLAGCPVLDAGIFEGGLPEAGADGGAPP